MYIRPYNKENKITKPNVLGRSLRESEYLPIHNNDTYNPKFAFSVSQAAIVLITTSVAITTTTTIVLSWIIINTG
jgi:hypothetical protein